ncbi:N-6 DNA methylase [Methanobrevibacter sp.]
MKTKKKSTNYSLLRNLISKSRGYTLPEEISYIIIYAFLYKYCSDSLKSHFQFLMQDKEMTLDEAYGDEHYRELFKDDAFHLYGFHIEKPEAFLDEVINNSYSDRFFLTDFFNLFQKSIIFDENRDKGYFKFLFETISQKIHIDKYEFDNEMNLAIKEIIYSISKLDIFESEFPFNHVFDILASSRLMRINSNPDYISQILSSLIACEKTAIKSAYDPFLKNATSLIELTSQTESIEKYYGKESDNLAYCYSLVKLLINYYDMDFVELKNEDAIESVDIDGMSFDVIISKIPVSIKNYYSSNEQQSFEMAKRNKRSELEEVLRKNFNMATDSFAQDSELNIALENLLEKMDVENDRNIEFVGEYESLKDNEFLFLINLIDSLKDEGIMAVSISQNFLFKNSLKTLRKYLTLEKNYIDTIISIPDDLSRRRPEVVIVFKKNKTNSDILFIDLSKNFNLEKNKRLFPGLFKRNLILSHETINKLQEIFSNKLAIDKLSNVISIDEVRKNDFNLAVSRYVDTFEGKFIKLDDLIDEKNQIESNIENLNLKIEKMMNELNIRFK